MRAIQPPARGRPGRRSPPTRARVALVSARGEVVLAAERDDHDAGRVALQRDGARNGTVSRELLFARPRRTSYPLLECLSRLAGIRVARFGARLHGGQGGAARAIVPNGGCEDSRCDSRGIALPCRARLMIELPARARARCRAPAARSRACASTSRSRTSLAGQIRLAVTEACTNCVLHAYANATRGARRARSRSRRASTTTTCSSSCRDAGAGHHGRALGAAPDSASGCGSSARPPRASTSLAPRRRHARRDALRAR